MLCPSGDDKSRIRCHLFGLPFFGITPNGLVCTPIGLAVCAFSSTSRPSASSSLRYSVTISGCSSAESMLLDRSFSTHWPGSKPIRNPFLIPRSIYPANFLSGCSCNSFSHLPSLSGVIIRSMASGKVWMGSDPRASCCRSWSVYSYEPEQCRGERVKGGWNLDWVQKRKWVEHDLAAPVCYVICLFLL